MNSLFLYLAFVKGRRQGRQVLGFLSEFYEGTISDIEFVDFDSAGSGPLAGSPESSYGTGGGRGEIRICGEFGLSRGGSSGFRL